MTDNFESLSREDLVYMLKLVIDDRTKLVQELNTIYAGQSPKANAAKHKNTMAYYNAMLFNNPSGGLRDAILRAIEKEKNDPQPVSMRREFDFNYDKNAIVDFASGISPNKDGIY